MPEHNIQPAGQRVALYVRQSQTNGETSASLEAQEADLRALAVRRGWQVHAVYRDADAPADALERRTRWLDLLDDAEAGRFTIVAAYDTSRLWRSVQLQISTCSQLASAGVTTVATMSGDQPTDGRDNPEAELVGTLLAAVSQFDNRLRRAKSIRGRRQAAERGEPHRGGNRPYGYRDARTAAGGHPTRTVVPGEAEVIREAVSRLLEGEPLNAVADDLNARGVSTVTGAPWSGPVLRRTVTRPALAGLSTWQGEVVGTGQWEAIISGEDHRRLLRRFDGDGRRPSSATLLGGGLAHCGRCRHQLSGQWTTNRRSEPVPLYRCVKRRGGCGLSVNREHADDEVVGRVIYALSTPGLAEAIRAASENADAAEAQATLSQLATRRGELGQMAADGVLHGDALRAALTRLDELEREAEALASQVGTGDLDTSLLDEVGDDAQAWWDDDETTDHRRRALLRLVTLDIRVKPAPRDRGPRFDGGRIVIDWRA